MALSHRIGKRWLLPIQAYKRFESM